jgi:hypothetical protein
MIASWDDWTIVASRFCASVARRRSVTSRTAADTSTPSSVSIEDSEISHGNSVPSLRRAASSIPAPIGRACGWVK